MAEREKELQQITQQYGNTDAESWIKNGTKNDDDKIKIIEEPINAINTIKPILMDKPKTEKRVTFEVKETKKEIDILPPTSNNFLSGLY